MTTLLPGTEVHARGLRWEIVAADQLGGQTLYRLRCADGALRGQELDLLVPFEAVEPVRHALLPERAAPLPHWRLYHQAFLLEQALGPDALLAVQPGRLRLEPYQLVPVLRALRMSRVRLLLADAVGLGKTVQAGLVITELIARRLAHRVLVVAPAGPLLEQWRAEMAERFGLRLELIDRERIEAARRANELGANPFDALPLGLASIDFLKQEQVLTQLERASYDVVVIDEAHHCMDLGDTPDRADSQRRSLAALLARRCDALLLLTATPHDGNDRSFASLCELLDPSLVDGRGLLRGERYRAHVIRRLKHHISDAAGRPRFRERTVTPCPVEVDPQRHAAFVELQRGLLGLVAPQLRRAFRVREYSDVLAYLALLKRSVSSVAACKETLDAVASRLQRLLTEVAESQDSRRQRLRTLRDYQRRLERFGTLGAEDEQAQRLLESEELAQQLADLARAVRSGAGRQEQQARVVQQLEALIDQADAALDSDPKLDALVALASSIRAGEPGANLLIYTEYTDSQQAAARALERAGLGPVLLMSGEDDHKARSLTTEQFRSRDGLVLVSTDAAAEGLNLQQRCHHLIHLELPFNPNRLEQRNGRIDRFGQTHDPLVFYLYLAATFEERILLRLIAKYERQRARLTFVPNTLGLVASTDAGAARLLEGLMDEDELRAEAAQRRFDFGQADEADGADKATRELLEEIDRSLHGFEATARSSRWLVDQGLNADAGLLAEAADARARGAAGAVDLLAFVCDAVRLDGGELRLPEPAVYELTRLPAWVASVEELPGYEPAARRLALTADLDRTHDSGGRPVGYLGRAHPLVRRALDRVRHLALGGAAQSGQDLRVSAARAPVPAPTLLWTFVGRILCAAGRVLEQVVAVELRRAGDGLTAVWHPTPERWQALAASASPIRTTGVYAQHFQPWFAPAQNDAQDLARRMFCDSPDTAAFVASHQRALAEERARLDEWLRQRAREISGAAVRAPDRAVQMSLFEPAAQDGPQAAQQAGWAALEDPAARLAGFALDSTQPARARGEAEGVLRIDRQRRADLDARAALRPPELVALGVLMLLPD
ncbi:MAG TPA: helicase-related protein [Roseiflexaceae bacterium]|nr:helicase-related protein [Roseiflexaceae bacterium]